MQKIPKSLISIANKITERDVQALKSIYDLRCLTQKQIYELHYSKSSKNNKTVSDSYCKTKIQLFLELNLIEKVEFQPKEFCYFLTSRGVDIVRAHYNLPHNIFDSRCKVVTRGYLRASELKMNTRIINHQIALNQFYSDIQQEHLICPFKYEDAKHAQSFTSIAPDAFLTAYDTYFFIELDMGTESKKLLLDKWNHYRRFLNSDEYFYSERKVIVLFIIENIDDVKKRADLVKSTFFESLGDLASDYFDMLVGDKEYIIDCLTNKFFKHPKSIAEEAYSLSKTLSSLHSIQSKAYDTLPSFFKEIPRFDLLSKKSLNDTSIFFIVDDAKYLPASIITKMAYFEVSQNLIYNKSKETVYLLLIVDSIDSIYCELSTFSLFKSNIYFTTHPRLNTLPFNKAICQIDTAGNVYTLNSSLSSKVFSYNIYDKSLNK